MLYRLCFLPPVVWDSDDRIWDSPLRRHLTRAVWLPEGVSVTSPSLPLSCENPELGQVGEVALDG